MKVKTLYTLMANRCWLACTIVLLCLLLSSCEKSERETQAKSERVVLMYMGGDNDLSVEAHEKIEAISQGWQANPQDRLLIYIDSADDLPKLYELSEVNGQTVQRLLFTYKEENSASKEVFSRVVKDVQILYNPESYGLIVCSHASGWLPKQTLAQPQSVVTDNNDEIELCDFAAAIPDSTFSFIVFDASFMAGVEVAHQLKDKTEYIVASSTEIVSPFTPVYSEAIGYLFETTPNLQGFVDKVFDYSDSQNGSATFSIIKTSELDQLASWLESNVFWLKTADINKIQHFDRGSRHLFYDFEDYYKQLLPKDEQKSELTELVAKCVIYKKATPTFMLEENGFEIKEYSGLTTYILQDLFPFLNSEYKKLSWSIALGLK